MNAATKPQVIVYPDSDGEPMADNPLQLEWMEVLHGNLDAAVPHLVCCNNFWYPREGDIDYRLAPDVFVVVGRPKGLLESYVQAENEDVPVTVVFEIWSPGNTREDMETKYDFYERNGVEEYYIYDPDANRLEIYLRRGTVLRRQWKPDDFTSPRLGIRFDVSTDPVKLTIWGPDGERFLTFAELKAAALQQRIRAETAEAVAGAAEARAGAAEARAGAAEARAGAAEARAGAAEARAARIAELGRKARRGLASPDELAELDRLEEGTSS